MKTTSTLSIRNRTIRHSAITMLLLLPRLASAQSSFSFNQAVCNCSESDGSVVLQVVRSGAADTLASVDYRTVDGTAHSGIRYTTASGTLQFAAGQTSLQVTVPILNDGLALGNQNFRVLLSNPSDGAQLGNRTNVIVTVAENDLGIQFVNPTYVVSEGAGAAQVGVVRTGDGGGQVTIDIFSTDLTAKNGVDYVGVTNHVTFAPTEVAKAISIPILNNTTTEPTRSFRVTLTNASGTSLGPLTVATVNIQDDDLGFRFETAAASVNEDAGAVLLGVLRGTDNTNAAVSVDFFTMNQTAESGSDYLGMTNTLTFAPGETRKTLVIPIVNDGVREPNQTLRVCLTNPCVGMALSSPSSLSVTVVDNDPQLGFDRSSYTASRSANEITLPVLRGKDVNPGGLAVQYATSDFSAKAGVDYQAISGTLQFETNETIKAIRVPLLANRPFAALKTFRVTLSNPTGGATLGTATATVSLQGTFFTLGSQFADQLAIHRDAGFSLLTWLGDGQLQRADRPDGPWTSLGSVKSPLAVSSTSSTLSGSFYRIKNPRPVSLYVPAVYDGRTPMPLVIALHGFTSRGSEIDSYFNLTSFAASKGFLYCYPEGLVLRTGGQDWNCWFEDAVWASFYSLPYSDDVGFIRGIIEAVGQSFNLDRKRVYLMGHSQGGGMSQFMALHWADLIAGIADLAGDPAVFYPPPSEPVNILRIHGTADETDFYNDSLPTAPPYSPLWPGALHVGQIWADFNGATGRVTDSAPTLDLESSLPGLDTVITRWTNAPPGGAVEVWSILGAHHSPSLTASFTPAVLDWLWAHPKP